MFFFCKFLNCRNFEFFNSERPGKQIEQNKRSVGQCFSAIWSSIESNHVTIAGLAIMDLNLLKDAWSWDSRIESLSIATFGAGYIPRILGKKVSKVVTGMSLETSSRVWSCHTLSDGIDQLMREADNIDDEELELEKLIKETIRQQIMENGFKPWLQPWWINCIIINHSYLVESCTNRRWNWRVQLQSLQPPSLTQSKIKKFVFPHLWQDFLSIVYMCQTPFS